LLETTSTVAAAILGGIELSWQLQNEQHHPSHLYLGWAQLLINPQVRTPWQVLFASRNDHAYITTMGFDVRTFDAILFNGFEYTWLSTPISQSDIDCGSDP